MKTIECVPRECVRAFVLTLHKVMGSSTLIREIDVEPIDDGEYRCEWVTPDGRIVGIFYPYDDEGGVVIITEKERFGVCDSPNSWYHFSGDSLEG
ncbi:hypothetical protein ACFL2R_02985 [Patescibacteria group bacterium]